VRQIKVLTGTQKMQRKEEEKQLDSWKPKVQNKKQVNISHTQVGVGQPANKGGDDNGRVIEGEKTASHWMWNTKLSQQKRKTDHKKVRPPSPEGKRVHMKTRINL
jgi:hypothetical protein